MAHHTTGRKSKRFLYGFTSQPIFDLTYGVYNVAMVLGILQYESR